MVEKVTIIQYICGNCLSLKFNEKNFRHQIVCYAGIPWDEKKSASEQSYFNLKRVVTGEG